MAIIPTDEGYGMMVSTFQSIEFGFGMHANQEEPKIVKKWRRQNQPYFKSVDSAMKCNGKLDKDDLKLSPYCIFFNLVHKRRDTGTMITWHCSLKTV